jgi:signal transduction histidine kinase
MAFRKGKTESQHTSPRRRKGVGGRISISLKLFAYLAVFTAFILVVVWVMQIGLLNHFYRQSKQKELNTADTVIAEAILNDPASLEDVARSCALDYLLCIRVFRLEGQNARQVVSETASGDCLIHRISNRYLTELYNRAVGNGGVYTRQVSLQALALSDPDALVGRPGESILLPGDKEDFRDFFRDPHLDQEMNMIHVRVVTGDLGERYIILLNSELEPLNATVETLNTQFWVIAFILFWGALFLAVLISGNISAPIRKMNRAAKELAAGSYDADFSVEGFCEVVELSESLTDAAEKLSRNDRLQKELVANISHDLRTPLTMIKGYSEVMRDIPGENTPENVQVIIDETERLSGLVNDLLDLSKLQAGTVSPKLEVFNLTEVAEATMHRYDKLTQKDGYRITYDCDGSVEVSADRTMILQVIYNLINNAINYTGEDKTVRVTQRRTEDGRRVRMSISDSGAGIAPDQIPLIWDRYYKVDRVHRRAMIGTGLGLSIVKQILEAHRATYGVESKLGEGSTFWFELEVVNEESRPLAAPSRDTEKGNN